jgi:hypothetical protein
MANKVNERGVFFFFCCRALSIRNFIERSISSSGQNLPKSTSQTCPIFLKQYFSAHTQPTPTYSRHSHALPCVCYTSQLWGYYKHHAVSASTRKNAAKISTTPSRSSSSVPSSSSTLVTATSTPVARALGTKRPLVSPRATPLSSIHAEASAPLEDDREFQKLAKQAPKSKKKIRAKKRAADAKQLKYALLRLCS